MSCAVPGCTNNRKNSSKTLFALPKDERLRKSCTCLYVAKSQPLDRGTLMAQWYKLIYDRNL